MRMQDAPQKSKQIGTFMYYILGLGFLPFIPRTHKLKGITAVSVEDKVTERKPLHRLNIRNEILKKSLKKSQIVFC